jgi:hypothetical protein
MGTKLLIGKNPPNLSRLMEIKLKWRWLNYGRNKLAVARFHGNKKIGFTRKKNYGYQERDEFKPLLFKEKIAPYVSEDIVYIDEYEMDSREDYSYGWNAKDQRFYALKSGRRQGRVNMIAAPK